MNKLYKYQATGNDFILFSFTPQDPSQFALKVCDRHFGIGADGIMYPSKSKIADIKMNYYNNDGTIAPMCGNGIRSFAKFLYDQKLFYSDVIEIETLAGVMIVKRDGDLFEVDLGKPVTQLKYPDIDGIQLELKPYKLQVKDNEVEAYVFNQGTLHTIVYVEDVNQFDDIANALCHHPFFPKRSNINFVKVLDDEHLEIKTYERGVGWTLSCGTGSSASGYLSYYLGKTKNMIEAIIPGGRLWIRVCNENVFLKGSAQFIAGIEMEIEL